MKKFLMMLAVLAAAFILIGCGEKEPATEATEATESATEAVKTAETHDCDGGCGMKNVPMDQLTEIDGKYYCAGCAKSAEKDHSHDNG